MLNVLARNFKTIEKCTLYLAFFINVILLFHRVDIGRGQQHQQIMGQIDQTKDGAEEAEGEGEGEDIVETIYIVRSLVSAIDRDPYIF